MDAKHLVVVGSGYAGILAALRAHRQAPKCRITLVSPSDVFVERIRLHELASSGRAVAHPLRRFLPEGIYFWQAAARHIDARRAILETTAGDVPFDALIVATGSQVRKGSLPGVADLGVPVECNEMGQLYSRLRNEGSPKRILVCGGGLTAIECATAVRVHHGAKVVLLTHGRLEPRLSTKGYQALRSSILKTGVAIEEHTTVERLDAGVAHTDRGPVEFDECIWACGMEGRPLGAESGLLVNERNQIVIDANLNPVTDGCTNVFVAGDAGAFSVNPGHPVYMGCKTAMPMGAHAADNAVGLLMANRVEPFSFRDALYCIALGKSGLVQFVEKDGTAGDQVWQGWRAAMVKNTINRFTVWALLGERRGIGYRWPRMPKQLPVAAQL